MPITSSTQTTAIELFDANILAELSKQADQVVADNIFGKYQATKSDNLIKNQRTSFNLFGAFLCSVSRLKSTDGLLFMERPLVWGNVSAGLIETFHVWMLNNGYTVSTANVRLSHVKTYAKLAGKGGFVDSETLARIKEVNGLSIKEAVRIDEKREVTRIGNKKAKATTVHAATATEFKRRENYPSTDQGARDCLLMVLLLDHGLRVGEVALLKIGDVDLEAGRITFYRPKVAKHGTHDLTVDSLRAIRQWADLLGAQDSESPLLRGTRKGGKLLDTGMSNRAIQHRVKWLGEQFGIDGLSPHDCRHAWATEAAKHSKLEDLMQAGGWNSFAMPLRYIEAKDTDNAGVKITY